MRWLEAFSLSVDLWERSKLQSLQLDDYFAGQQQLAFCLVSFGPGLSSKHSRDPDCLFLLLQQTSQGICHGCFASSSCFQQLNPAGYFQNASTLKTNAKRNQICWHQQAIIYNCYKNPTVFIFKRGAAAVRGFELHAKRQLNMLDVFKSSVQRFQRFQSSCGRNHVPDHKVHKGPLNPVMISHKIG